MTTNSTPLPDCHLIYGDTYQDLRQRIADQARRSEAAFKQALTGPQPSREPSTAEYDHTQLAHAASLYAWTTLALLGFIARHGGDDLAHRAANMIDDMGTNGGAPYCDDITDDAAPEAAR